MPHTASPFAINFVLRDLTSIVPWGAAPDLSLSWFGLTDGAYCIETQAGRLLDYRSEHDAGLGVSWCAYAVARFWEDLRELAPRALEPVPADIPPRLLAWLQTGAPDEPPDDDALYASWLGAQAWWGERQLDFGYLRHAPILHFWRVGDTMHLRWRCRETTEADCPFTVWQADAALPVAAFEAALARFETAFLGAMRERCETLARDGWSGTPCDIDPDAVLEEQAQREAEATVVPAPQCIDWDAVREDLDIMGA